MIALAVVLAIPNLQEVREKPIMRDFIGINTHTVQFRPDLYAPIAKLIRNYHPVEWDLGKDAGHYPAFPMTTNGVDWNSLYGKWKNAGFVTEASAMFETVPTEKWNDEDAFAYGFAFGRFFGKSKMLDAVEIGNEPGKVPDADYTRIFRSMASGIRKADPTLKIATCAMRVGPSGDYHKSIDLVKNSADLYDVINLHSYCEEELWPTFKRSYPEDPKVDFMKPVRELIEWRDKSAKGKEIWLTEFGWDSSTRKPDPNGPMSKWIGNSDTEQAQWIIRSFLEFSRLDLQRAYQYWFNDSDEPSLHAASGLTRNYVPKPSYYAMAYLQKMLGDYRYRRDILRKVGEVYVLEFEKGYLPSQKRWIAWVPTRAGAAKEFSLPINAQSISVSVIPLSQAMPEITHPKVTGGSVKLTLSGTPTIITFP